MTSSDLEEFAFSAKAVDRLGSNARHLNWPVVYALSGRSKVYLGESLYLANRMRQHLRAKQGAGLNRVHALVRDDFNKSACLDLESHLIQWFAAEGSMTVLNQNAGVVDAEYFDRHAYRAAFPRIFDALLSELRPTERAARPSRSTDLILELENSELYKLSPFKALNQEQAQVIEQLIEGLADDLRGGTPSTSVVHGEPGTGKTVLAVFLMKLLRDLAHPPMPGVLPEDSVFGEFFTEGYPELFAQLERIAIVVPQQSLRKSLRSVFAKTAGLRASMVIGPFEAGGSTEPYDLLLVDETHRLSQRASQSTGSQNAQFPKINHRHWGQDDLSRTQLDWIVANSKHQIFLLDIAQRVRPADLPVPTLRQLTDTARRARRLYSLTTQMRVRGGASYVDYVRKVLDPRADVAPRELDFGEYDLRLFDDLAAMRAAITRREDEVGLSRLVAGYAWPWRTKTARQRGDDLTEVYDIEIGEVRLRWNSTVTDWVNSSESPHEVGSIHTVQGYDLNYAGVIIGPDLRYDRESGRLRFDRSHYFDARGMQNNPQLGLTYSDDDIVEYIANIYAVLMTRGIRGTYVYVCDPALREHLRRFFA